MTSNPKIFISYDYDNDRNYKNMLVAWDKNKEFNFSFSDFSVDVSVQSRDPAAIKRVISSKINSSPYFLCLVGKNTHKSKWVIWEIQKAKELGKKLIAVKLDRTNLSPSGLLNSDVSWAMSFNLISIRNVIGSK